MLQGVLVKRIERIYRLRLIYGLHLAAYGLALIVFFLTYTPTNLSLPLALWLPLILAHTTLQSWYELRARCYSYQPVPIENLRRYHLPIDLYDEQGNPVNNGLDRLPRPHD